MTQGPWKVTSNIIDGKMMYGVFRPLGNPGEPDHSGNREVAAYRDTKEEAQKLADELNEVAAEQKQWAADLHYSAEINREEESEVGDIVFKETKIPIEMIEPNPNNPRKRFDEAKLQELAESIREVGILQPLVITRGQDGRYLLITGERRLEAAGMAGLEHVPVVYRDVDTEDSSLPLMLIENLQREDLDPIEEARAFEILTRDHGWKQTELAEKLGISQSHIANRIRLLVLPESIQEGISEGRVTATVGKELVTYAKVPGVAEVLDEAMSDGNDDGGEELLWTAKNNAYDNIMPLHHHAHPDPQFNLKSCEKCRERIHLPNRWDNAERLPWCTNKSCWKEKQEAALKEIAERARQQVLDTGEEIVSLTDLPYDSYGYLKTARFDQAECRQCEHNKMGLYSSEYMEREPEPVCLNPACFKAKGAAAEKEARRREKQLKAAHEERKEELIAGFFPQALFAGEVDRDDPEFRVLIYIAAQVIHHPPWSSRMTKAKVEDAVYERYGWKKPEGLSWSEEEKHLVQLLSTLTTEELLRLMLFVTLKPVEYDNQTFKAVFGEGESD